MRLLVPLLLAGSLPSFGVASEPTVSIIEFGVICDIEAEGQRPAPLTESGFIGIIDQTRAIDAVTTIVPAALGISFGVRIQLDEGATSVGTRMVVTHPPMGTKGVSVESWSAPLSPGEPNLNLFTFEYDYELVQGRWAFAVFDDSGKVAEQVFDVVPRQAAPHALAVCFGSELMS